MVKELFTCIVQKKDFQQIRELSSRLSLVFDQQLPGATPRNIEAADILRRFLSLLGSIITAPIIYSVYIPLSLLDLMASIYQAICFPIYGIKKVSRSEYVVIDRHKLSYLSWVEKINCIYCGYGNGVLYYVSEIASKTESYWCPIKHKEKIKGSHERYDSFCEYGDESAYNRVLKENANSWRV
ncbi:MAG: hypothetical protein HQL71_13090 [Magnetococcales bacterium]|nr:hypothetical protein [Magnetococcales bacterium]